MVEYRTISKRVKYRTYSAEIDDGKHTWIFNYLSRYHNNSTKNRDDLHNSLVRNYGRRIGHFKIIRTWLED